jgi:hypothetical protein
LEQEIIGIQKFAFCNGIVVLNEGLRLTVRKKSVLPLNLHLMIEFSVEHARMTRRQSSVFTRSRAARSNNGANGCPSLGLVEASDLGKHDF